MKTLFKNRIFIIIMIVLTIFIVGCNSGEKKGSYNSENYYFFQTYEFKKELTIDEAKTALDVATKYFSEAKSYSYNQKIVGYFDEEYIFEGITKIDVTGETPKASLELVGSSENSFYIANNKAYFNYDGYKTVRDIEADFSNVSEVVQSVVGVHVSFTSENITSENLEYAGVDNHDATVIKFIAENQSTIIIVIHDNKIMKVMMTTEEGKEFVADYNYEPVTVTLPADLDSYVSE